MTVDPVNRGQVPSPGPSHAGKSESRQRARPDGHVKPETAETAADRVELSPAAKELRELAAANRPEANTISPERMKQVLQRIADGFYDRPEVIDEVARRLDTDLQ
jgi:hypothetical protein